MSAEWLDLIQWPAMVVSIAPDWLVASQNESRREIGFWTFASNVLWIVWGWHAGALALVGLQVFLGGMNIRGIVKNERARHRPTWE